MCPLIKKNVQTVRVAVMNILGLICKRAVWDTDDEGYWQENYKGIDDWKLREL